MTRRQIIDELAELLPAVTACATTPLDQRDPDSDPAVPDDVLERRIALGQEDDRGRAAGAGLDDPRPWA